ncbi:hypothetical protein DCCM_4881 [Desulfocucumis palustris]|uniref:Uncharacterized protein n=1 Tax=Desulfocucumis palustris TaxID=1898651 RepID=A0A2L2XN21_9FIRM|nr:hypothetical protein DCCM_4881 [Desulfocucumis palustris]
MVWDAEKADLEAENYRDAATWELSGHRAKKGMGMRSLKGNPRLCRI